MNFNFDEKSKHIDLSIQWLKGTWKSLEWKSIYKFYEIDGKLIIEEDNDNIFKCYLYNIKYLNNKIIIIDISSKVKINIIKKSKNCLLLQKEAPKGLIGLTNFSEFNRLN